jgi:hypothetical protein
MQKWEVETMNGTVLAPDPVKAEHGFVVRWTSPTSGYHRETPPVATRSGAVAVWAGLAGHTVWAVIPPDGCGVGINRCDSCDVRSEKAETQDDADARDHAAGWHLGDTTICHTCKCAARDSGYAAKAGSSHEP